MRQNPGRYLNAFDRTLAFYAGMNGAESDNRIYRDEVLSETLPGSKIRLGPEPLRSHILHDFEQRTTCTWVMILVRGFIPIYESLLIAAGFITVFGLVFAIIEHDLGLLVCCL